MGWRRSVLTMLTTLVARVTFEVWKPPASEAALSIGACHSFHRPPVRVKVPRMSLSREDALGNWQKQLQSTGRDSAQGSRPFLFQGNKKSPAGKVTHRARLNHAPSFPTTTAPTWQPAQPQDLQTPCQTPLNDTRSQYPRKTPGIQR